jgi:signal transduction histidine kinase
MDILPAETPAPDPVSPSNLATSPHEIEEVDRSNPGQPPIQTRPTARPTRAKLLQRLVEAEEIIRVIRNKEVDAVVGHGEGGELIFTLDAAGRAYRVLIESMHEGALTLTSDATIFFANPSFARIVGCPIEEVIGSVFTRFLSAADWAILGPLVQHAADGSIRPVQISLCWFAADGQTPATVGLVVTDMTEAQRVARHCETERLYARVVQQAAELEGRVEERTQELLQANQELQAFEASVSHDLRGPLLHMVGFSEILLEKFAPQLPAEAQLYLNKIRGGAEKMQQLIKALLEFSRVSKRPLTRKPVDIDAMWHEVLAEMRPEFGQRKIDVTIDPLPPCVADPILLRQVIINLLGNAVKYSRTRERSVIAVTAVVPPDGGSPTYLTRDNGIGFDMKHAGKLFEVFERLPNARSFEGTGVGLTTVQRIVQRHGGRIWAESTPNAGATFSFTLGDPPPAEALSESTPGATAGPAAADHSSTPRSFLVQRSVSR